MTLLQFWETVLMTFDQKISVYGSCKHTKQTGNMNQLCVLQHYTDISDLPEYLQTREIRIVSWYEDLMVIFLKGEGSV